ncbi:MAG: inositol monophosphatase family protein [Aerococcus sp.]|nr:inositol monophosphatase family protein [Aerococcus sp.]
MEVREYRELVKQWIIERGTTIRQLVLDGQKLIDRIDTKSSRTDLVTNIDKETEAFFRERLAETFPDDQILGEEGLGDPVTSLDGAVWIIDPIDGTSNFVLQQNHFGIMMARYINGVAEFGAIYDVMNDDYFEAAHGEGKVYRNGEPFNLRFKDCAINECLVDANVPMTMRNRFDVQDFLKQSMGYRAYGAASIEILAVLKGELGAYITPTLKPWDIAAGKVLLEELGLKVTAFNGEPIDLLHPDTTIMSYPTVHHAFVDFYQSHAK